MFKIVIDSYETDEDLARIDEHGMHLDHVNVEYGVETHCESVITVTTTSYEAAAHLCIKFGLDVSEIEEIN